MNDDVEFKALRAEVKAVDSDNPNGEFEAILSTDAVDRDGESIAPGAFDPLPASIPIFHSHDWQDGAMPVAKATPFYDGTVLKAHGVYASTARAQEMRALVTEGIVDSMSVGFLKAKRSKADGKTVVKSAELFEASFTAVPVNSTAKVLAAKAIAAKAGARNSKSDMEHIQAAHDHLTSLGAACGTKSLGTKAIVGTVEALQERVRDALEDAYGDYATYLRGVDPDQGVVYFDWWAGDGDHYQQSFADDGAVVTLEGAAVEVDVHEIVVPDADADRETDAGPTMLSTSADAAAAKAAAAPADDQQTQDLVDDLALRAASYERIAAL